MIVGTEVPVADAAAELPVGELVASMPQADNSTETLEQTSNAARNPERLAVNIPTVTIPGLNSRLPVSRNCRQ